MSHQQNPVASQQQPMAPAPLPSPSAPIPLDPKLFALVGGGTEQSSAPNNNW